VPTQSLAEDVKEKAVELGRGIKRYSRRMALSAQIEKLKNIDLRKAHYDLGKVCFEQDLFKEELKNEFKAIKKLDATIAEKKVGEKATAGETLMAMGKRVTKDVAKASHARALSVKRSHLIAALGRAAYPHIGSEPPAGVESEDGAIMSLNEKLEGLEKEVESLRHATSSQTPHIAVIAIALVICGGLFLIFRGKSSDPEISRSSSNITIADNWDERIRSENFAPITVSVAIYKEYMYGYNNPSAATLSRELLRQNPSRARTEGGMKDKLIVQGADDRLAGVPPRLVLR
jgi:hypothetical protein